MTICRRPAAPGRTAGMSSIPGSVGLPAYRDHAPFPHAMEAGSPHARYSIVIQRGIPGLTVENIAVAYDWNQRRGRGRQERPSRLGRLPAQRPRLTIQQ